MTRCCSVWKNSYVMGRKRRGSSKNKFDFGFLLVLLC